jgi:hypothetical protein
MGDKSPKAKRKNESQKQAKSDAIHQVRQQAIDEGKTSHEKHSPSGKRGKGN